jgi:hypothetical protein
MELNMEGMIIERGDSVLYKWSSSLCRERLIGWGYTKRIEIVKSELFTRWETC